MQTDESYRPMRIFLPVVVLVAALVSFGCGNEQDMEEASAPPETTAPVEASAPPQPEPDPEPVEQRRQATAEGSYREDTRWAPGREGILIEGLNGGEYPPYQVSVIERFQRFLFERDIYDGPVTGILDERTMQAIADFQRANGIVASGVPSPETRDAAQQARANADSDAG